MVNRVLMRPAVAGWLALAVLAAPPQAAPQPGPGVAVAPVTVELTGSLARADHLRWIDVPFDVPAGVTRLDLDFSHDGAAHGTAIEVGVLDPRGMRGNSRTSKRRFHIAASSASPSYVAGPLPQGRWHLRLGVATIREGVETTWRAVLRFSDEDAAWASAGVPARESIAPGPRWYRGDFHTHTGHSDGFGCDDGRGGRRACTVHDVAATAAARGLDFVAVTDHNTVSHHADLASVQIAFPHLLLLRGQEMTTFQGHANAYGTSTLVDFRIGHPGVTASAVFAETRRQGGLVSINHPGRETGERCTGCGWSAEIDYTQVDAMEVVNGQVVEGPTAGLPVWRARLDEGARLIAIAGSDDHSGGRDGRGIGTPTTVVFADDLTERALLHGVRRGRVYVRTRGVDGPSIDMTARRPGSAGVALMGDTVEVARGGTAVAIAVAVGQASGQVLELWRDGQPEPAHRLPIDRDAAVVEAELILRPGGWVHALVRDAAGITAIGNPIFAR